jgi:hypothetical protein
VVAAPVIATNPMSQVVTAGSSVTFSVAATGEQLTYQWLRNGANIAGAVASTFTLPNVQLSDSQSTFGVSVTNPGGTVASANAVLTVNAAANTTLSFLAGDLGALNNATPSGGVDASALYGAQSVVADATGNLYVATDARIMKITPSGVVTLFAGSTSGYADGPALEAKFGGSGTGGRLRLAMDAAGSIYVADLGSLRLRKITPDGNVSTVGTAFTREVSSVTVSPTGVLYYIGSFVNPLTLGTKSVVSLVNGQEQTYVAETHIPRQSGIQPIESLSGKLPGLELGGVAVDKNGVIYVIVSNLQGPTTGAAASYIVKAVPGQAAVTVLAGSISEVGAVDGPGAVARFGYLSSISVDDQGNLFVADTTNRAIRKVSPDGTVSTVIGQLGSILQTVALESALPGRLRSPLSATLAPGGTINVVDSACNTPPESFYPRPQFCTGYAVFRTR